MGWWDSAQWKVRVLGPQDHLGEYVQLSGVPLDAITGHPKNQDRKTARAASGTAVDPKDLPFQPGDSVFLPEGPPAASLPVQQGTSNTFAGALPAMTVEIRFRALRLPAAWTEMTPSADLSRKLGGASTQDRWEAQWDDFLRRAVDVELATGAEVAAGLTFQTRRVNNGSPNEVDASATSAAKDRFTTDKVVKAADPLDFGTTDWSGGPKRLLVTPLAHATLYRPGPSVCLEQSLKVSGSFASVDSTYLVRRADAGRPVAGNDYSSTWGTTLAAATGKPSYPSFSAPDFQPPRLLKLGLFHRTFEIVYRLPYDRGTAAAFSSSVEINLGAGAPYNYKAPKFWWEWGTQSGYLINKYRLWPAESAGSKPRAPAVVPAWFPYDYASWSTDAGTADKVRKVSAAAPYDNWCGFFHGFNYVRAGYDSRDPILLSGIIEPAGSRYVVFFSGPKLQVFFDKEQRPWCAFPGLTCQHYDPQNSHNNVYVPRDEYFKDDAKRKAFLDQVVAPWAPRRGDIIIVNPNYGDPPAWHNMGHVAMVWSYDPKTYALVTREGNNGPLAAAFQKTLLDPHSFATIAGIGRFLESDFDRGPDADLARFLKEGSAPPDVTPSNAPKKELVNTDAQKNG